MCIFILKYYNGPILLTTVYNSSKALVTLCINTRKHCVKLCVDVKYLTYNLCLIYAFGLNAIHIHLLSRGDEDFNLFIYDLVYFKYGSSVSIIVM